MNQNRYAEHSVLFDAPGPKTKRIIAIVNLVSGAVIAAVLLLVAVKLAQMGQLDAAMWQPV
ncbi:MAG: hypothetical protein LBI84_01415, partial [Propionibacteriaceae bacterium]|nr:hypothetical protein [Propionibacteriaceae bacterium]